MQKIIDGKRFNTATAVRLLPLLLFLVACQTAPSESASPEQARAEYECLKENQYIAYRPPINDGFGTGLAAAMNMNSGERLVLDERGYQACLRARGY